MEIESLLYPYISSRPSIRYCYVIQSHVYMLNLSGCPGDSTAKEPTALLPIIYRNIKFSINVL